MQASAGSIPGRHSAWAVPGLLLCPHAPSPCGVLHAHPLAAVAASPTQHPRALECLHAVSPMHFTPCSVPVLVVQESRQPHMGINVSHIPCGNDFWNAYNLKHANEKLASPCLIWMISSWIAIITRHISAIMLFAVCLAVFWGGVGGRRGEKEKKKGKWYFLAPSLVLYFLLFVTCRSALSSGGGQPAHGRRGFGVPSNPAMLWLCGSLVFRAPSNSTVLWFYGSVVFKIPSSPAVLWFYVSMVFKVPSSPTQPFHVSTIFKVPSNSTALWFHGSTISKVPSNPTHSLNLWFYESWI